MDSVVAWSLDRPPILDSDLDFPTDRAAGEVARDIWYAQHRWPDDELLPVVDAMAKAEV